MKTAMSLLLNLTFVLFFSLRPISLSSVAGGIGENMAAHGEDIAALMKNIAAKVPALPHVEDVVETGLGKVAPKMFSPNPEFRKGASSGVKAHKVTKKALKIIGGGDRPSTENQDDHPTMAIIVGNPPQLVAAHLSISSSETWIETYPSYRPNLYKSLGTGYIVINDTILLNSAGIKFQTTFLVSAIGPPLPLTKGRINFSKDVMSVVSNLAVGIRRFSYFIPYKISRQASDVLLSNKVNFIRPGIQSTNQVPIPGLPHLYGVPLIQISVTNDNCLIIPQLDLYAGVSLSTDVPETMLAPVAYMKVRSKILQHMGTLTAIIPNMRQYEMCYHVLPQAHWPDLTLSFAGVNGVAQMVLKKENYVVRDDATGSECAAIIPSTSPQGLSVIGTMAQRNREMIFDNDRGMVHFDQFPAFDPQ